MKYIEKLCKIISSLAPSLLTQCHLSQRERPGMAAKFPAQVQSVRESCRTKRRLRWRARDPNAICLFCIQKLCYTVLNRRFAAEPLSPLPQKESLWNTATGTKTTSALPFKRLMRFPTKADGTIDEERAEALLNTAKAAGVNYFDTAYPYHNGQSEPFVGRVIAKWDRSSFYLATKMLWKCKSLDDAAYFEEQLQRLAWTTSTSTCCTPCTRPGTRRQKPWPCGLAVAAEGRRTHPELWVFLP